HSERPVGDIALGPLGRDRHVGQDALRLVGVVTAHPGALVHLCQALRQRLAHLVRHQDGQLLPITLEQVGEHPHRNGAVGDGDRLPLLLERSGSGYVTVDFGGRSLFVLGENTPVGGADRGDHAPHYGRSPTGSQPLVVAFWSISTGTHRSRPRSSWRRSAERRVGTQGGRGWSC